MAGYDPCTDLERATFTYGARGVHFFAAPMVVGLRATLREVDRYRKDNSPVTIWMQKDGCGRTIPFRGDGHPPFLTLGPKKPFERLVDLVR